jgi:hypothetical protein
VFNAFDITAPVPAIAPLDQRQELFANTARTGQYKRCPGGAEEPAPDGSNVPSASQQAELDCREADRATGDIKP